jgi:hypothetical protein
MIKDLEANKNIGLNPFAGVYMSTINCLKCGPQHEVHRWEVCYDLSVDLSMNLENSLREYFKTEYIDDYICIQCSIREFLKKEEAKDWYIFKNNFNIL